MEYFFLLSSQNRKTIYDRRGDKIVFKRDGVSVGYGLNRSGKNEDV
jgi:hypothetical protein